MSSNIMFGLPRNTVWHLKEVFITSQRSIRHIPTEYPSHLNGVSNESTRTILTAHENYSRLLRELFSLASRTIPSVSTKQHFLPHTSHFTLTNHVGLV